MNWDERIRIDEVGMEKLGLMERDKGIGELVNWNGEIGILMKWMKELGLKKLDKGIGIDDVG